MSVEQENAGNGKENAGSCRSHPEKNPNEQRAEKHAERAVAALPAIEKKLDRAGQKRSCTKTGPLVRRQIANGQINYDDCQPTSESEWKSRGKVVITKHSERGCREVILQPGMAYHDELVIEPCAFVRLGKGHTV